MDKIEWICKPKKGLNNKIKWDCQPKHKITEHFQSGTVTVGMNVVISGNSPKGILYPGSIGTVEKIDGNNILVVDKKNPDLMFWYDLYDLFPPTPLVLKSMAGSQIWLDAMDPLGRGTTPRNGTIITTWKDKSGNNRDAISNGSPIIRSKQIVFNGINQSFKIPYQGAHQDETGFIVLTFADGNARSILMGDAGSNIRQISQHSNQITFCNYNIGCPIAINPIPVAGNQVILEYSINSDETYFYLNGTKISNGAGFNIVNENNLLIGSNPNKDNWFNGRMSEVIIFNRVLNIADRQMVEEIGRA
jgi:hypothetical protein